MENIANITPAITSAIQNSPSATLSKVGTALLSNQLDNIETMGDSMTKMMESSVTPYLGGNFDASV